MTGKTALVTGGAAGIGQAIAVALAAQGAEVFILDIADAAATGALIEQNSGKARAIRCDVSRERDVLAAMELIDRSAPALDIAVNCAGIQIIKPLLQTTLDELDHVIEVNLKGTFLVGREAARRMVDQPSGGRIINISSELAYSGRADFSAYCATKGAILSLTRSWARELAPKVLVNAVAPGPTDTAMLAPSQMTPQQRQREFDSVPLGRIATPEEIAAAVIFLAGPGGSFFTGQCISPCGGAVMF
jgi:3-oxoacyl-[acyl-carrier protein] reductase